ncbi:MAG: hypothetical protein WCJ58_09060 [bacterium]
MKKLLQGFTILSIFEAFTLIFQTRSAAVTIPESFTPESQIVRMAIFYLVIYLIFCLGLYFLFRVTMKKVNKKQVAEQFALISFILIFFNILLLILGSLVYILPFTIVIALLIGSTGKTAKKYKFLGLLGFWVNLIGFILIIMTAITSILTVSMFSQSSFI